MIKNIFLNTLIYLSAFASLCFSQNEPKDSIRIEKHPLRPMQKIILDLEQFDLYRDLNSVNHDLPVNSDPNTVWLWTSYAVSKSEFHNEQYGETPGNISRFLYIEYLEESEFNPVKYALGAVQVGAVGYLAYLHIKKYGFLK